MKKALLVFLFSGSVFAQDCHDYKQFDYGIRDYWKCEHYLESPKFPIGTPIKATSKFKNNRYHKNCKATLRYAEWDWLKNAPEYAASIQCPGLEDVFHDIVLEKDIKSL